LEGSVSDWLGVVREDKSEGSHQQKRCNDAQKLDTGLHSGWQAGNGLCSKTIRRTEFVTVRSSQFKIGTMEQKKEIAYQLELFDINGQSVIYPSPNRRRNGRTNGFASCFGRQTGTGLSVWDNGAGMQSGKS
jgi:hypothetical protein